MNVIKKENVIKKGKDIRKLGVIKKIKLVLLLLILIIAYCYSLIIGYLPDQIILFEGEKLDIPSFFGINFSMEDEYGVIETSSNISESISEDIGVSKMNVNLFNQLSIKDIDVSILPKTTVIPVGNLAGVKLYTNGVLVVGMSEIQGEDNKIYKPYEKTGIEEGDTIIAVNNQTIHSTEDLISCVNNSLGNEVEIDFVRYLKDHCRDAVVKEYTTATGDRYDVLVLNEDNQVYVFEIKWLGRSITTGMKVFENYNSDERAISGAYQLLDYVSNADTYKEYFLEFPVYCAILLIFDARDVDTDIVFPEDVVGIPNIDLSKRLFMEKKKINASSVYSSKRR